MLTRGSKKMGDLAKRTKGGQARLAALIDTPKSVVCGWISGKGRPNPFKRGLIAVKLGIPEHDWLTDEERLVLERAA